MNQSITDLVEYGVLTGLIEKEDKIYVTNLFLDCLKLEDYTAPAQSSFQKEWAQDDPSEHLEELLESLLDIAHQQGLLEENTTTYRDLFDTKLMNTLVNRPSEIIKNFYELYKETPQAATDYFYKLSIASNYIRAYRIKKDIKCTVDSPYGEIDITINLAKPEKDPKEIAAAKNAKQSAYPSCQLCVENEGYAGRTNHPARHNHRIMPITINDSPWGFQYSPYVYYNEHW